MGVMTDPVADAYLTWCQGESQPPNTVRARRKVLRAIGNPSTATREEVEAWWASRSHLAPSTRMADLAILREFYKWSDTWEHRDPDKVWPTNRLRAPKIHQGLPRPVHSVDMQTLLATLPADLKRAVLLGAWAGFRVSEAAKLTWADVDLEERQLRVTESKGGYSRLVAVDWALLDALLPDTGGNVVTGTADGYATGTLNRKVNRAIRAAGVDATFHQLRHRYGTLAYRESRDLLAVGRAMGHRSPSSTAIYAEPSDDVARQIAVAVTR